MKITSEKVIYIAQPTGSHLRRIVKDDPSCLKVNNKFLKVGKALKFSQRIKDYMDDNEKMVKVVPILDLNNWTKQEIGLLETKIKRQVRKFACYNEPGIRKDGSYRKRRGRTEWLKGISFKELENIIIDEFNKF
jgi:hypothetical protein